LINLKTLNQYIIRTLSYPTGLFDLIETLRSEPYFAVLTSTEGGLSHPKFLNRYTFICTKPFLIVRCKNFKIEIIIDQERRQLQGTPLPVIRDFMKRYQTQPQNRVFPFQGGGVGYFSYDFARYLERLPDLASDDLNTDDCFFMFFKKVSVVDHYQKQYFEVNHSEIKHEPLIFPFLSQRESGTGFRIGELTSNLTRDEFKKTVLKTKEYIRAGDIFQANLSQRFTCTFEGDPFKLFQKLIKINPSPFSFFLRSQDQYVISCSPERLLKISGRIIETRPIAGTRRRGQNEREDFELANELVLNEKERAEHIMLIDLERNDLGRVCHYGSVTVDELMTREKYSHVWHIVSNVRGQLRDDEDALDALCATFPGGTITGAPKIRAMQIIEELEPVRRGLYTGSLGYLDFCGNCDFNIIIRTMILQDKKIYFQSGAGIVADSDPDREFEETLHKAEALRLALFQT